MLLPKDILPEMTAYYYGAMILDYLLKVEEKVDIIQLYQSLKSSNELSIISFSLALDWLYLIEVVKVDSKGEVEICI